MYSRATTLPRLVLFVVSAREDFSNNLLDFLHGSSAVHSSSTASPERPYGCEVDAGVVSKFGVAKATYLSSKTVNNIYSVVRGLLGLARVRNLRQDVPEFDWRKVIAPETKFLSFSEADRLIAHAPKKWRVMITVAIHMGLRLGELFALAWTDVDWEHHQLTVRELSRRPQERKRAASSISLRPFRSGGAGSRKRRKGFWIPL